MKQFGLSPVALFWLAVVFMVIAGQLIRLSQLNRVIFNYALAFSIDAPLLLIYIISVLFLGVVIWLFYSRAVTTLLGIIGLGLIFGGGASNLIDRILFDGGVADYWHLMDISTINFADIAITAGIMLVLYQFLFHHES
ncbi:MAG: signal peptidase II [Patescibacteria group bacterium]|jgi:signal peptidase II